MSAFSFLCWDAESGDAKNGVLVDAFDAEMAAAKFAEMADDNSGGEITRSGEIVVIVADTAGERRFKVSAEPVISYTAWEDGA